jgi:hypothetical protein
MSVRARRSLGITLLAAILLGAFWYFEAGYFEDSKVSGEYVSKQPGITRRVWIRPDHTFHQEDIVNGVTRQTSGVWHGTTSTGRFWFSSNFIDVPDGVRSHDSDEVSGVFENWFGFVAITFNNSDLRLHKKLFS